MAVLSARYSDTATKPISALWAPDAMTRRVILSSPPAAVRIDQNLIEMPAGISVLVRATPRSDSSTEYKSKHRLTLESADLDIFDVRRSEDEDDEWVLIGVSPGSTCVRVDVDGDEQECLPVEISEP